MSVAFSARVSRPPTVRELARANSRKGTRVQRFFDVATLKKGTSTVDAALLVALDYNTVRLRMGGEVGRGAARGAGLQYGERVVASVGPGRVAKRGPVALKSH